MHTINPKVTTLKIQLIKPVREMKFFKKIPNRKKKEKGLKNTETNRNQIPEDRFKFIMSIVTLNVNGLKTTIKRLSDCLSKARSNHVLPAETDL